MWKAPDYEPTNTSLQETSVQGNKHRKRVGRWNNLNAYQELLHFRISLILQEQNYFIPLRKWYEGLGLES